MVSQPFSMSSVHCVVVWEWFDEASSQWLPYGPAVSQHLERAHGKQLTRVILSDADPTLVGCYVNLRTQTQCYDTAEGASGECGVRRACYSVASPAGRGAAWEWLRGAGGAGGGEPLWQALPVALQCLVEEAWARGLRCVELGGAGRPWRVDLAALAARGPGGLQRPVRRAQQAPYPLARAPPAAPPGGPPANAVRGRRDVAPPPPPPPPPPVRPPEGAASSRRNANPPTKDRNKTNLARQILHNLNIFGNKTSPESDSRNSKRRGNSDTNKTIASREEKMMASLDADSSSTRSGRRPSVDTISTYLSHESKDSCSQGPVGELLNCSLGSSSASEGAEGAGDAGGAGAPAAEGAIVGVDAASRGLGAFVAAVGAAQWGALCPLCARPLGGPRPGILVALVRCSHMLHLACLNDALTLQRRVNPGPLIITCGVCGRTYGGEECEDGEPEADLPPGDQPPGSMAWALQPDPPGPPYPPHTRTIQITYNISSGVQGPEHPTPGRPFYAVGFPRYTYLPDTPQGRKVLALIRWAWQRRLVATVARSATTGREHVAAWAPPLAPALAPLQQRSAAGPLRVAALHAALAALAQRRARERCPDHLYACTV